MLMNKLINKLINSNKHWIMLSIQMDLKSEKEKIHQMHHDIRMNALIDLLVKKGQNLSINSYHEKSLPF